MISMAVISGNVSVLLTRCFLVNAGGAGTERRTWTGECSQTLVMDERNEAPMYVCVCVCLCVEGGQGRAGSTRDCWNAWITRNSRECHAEYNPVGLGILLIIRGGQIQVLRATYKPGFVSHCKTLSPRAVGLKMKVCPPGRTQNPA